MLYQEQVLSWRYTINRSRRVTENESTTQTSFLPWRLVYGATEICWDILSAYVSLNRAIFNDASYVVLSPAEDIVELKNLAWCWALRDRKCSSKWTNAPVKDLRSRFPMDPSGNLLLGRMLWRSSIRFHDACLCNSWSEPYIRMFPQGSR